MTGNYIKRIEIDSLWRGVRHIVWDLQPGVNVLSGINGVGKSTILRKTVRRLTQGKEELEREYNQLGVYLTLTQRRLTVFVLTSFEGWTVRS